MENKNNDKIYFIPGNVVTIKHDLDNKPVMLVTEVVTTKISLPRSSAWGKITWSEDSYSCGETQVGSLKASNVFKGIRCGWFDNQQVWREQIFSTKDLIKVEEGE